MERGLWGFTQEGQETLPAITAEASAQRAFRLRSDKAYSLIALSIKKNLQVHIQQTTDPLEAWTTLQKHFECLSVSQIVRLNRKFYAATMEEGGDLMEHLTHMTSLAEQLRELKEDVTPRKVATVVIGSLPDSYETFISSLNARKAEELDWESIKPLLTKEYLKRKEKYEKPSSSSTSSSDDALFVKKGSHGSNRSRSHGRGQQCWGGYSSADGAKGSRDSRLVQQQHVTGPKCYKCREVGHMVKICPLNKNSASLANEIDQEACKVKTDAEPDEEIALTMSMSMIQELNTGSGWFIDSACTKHVLCDKGIIYDYYQYKKPTKVHLGDNTVIFACGEGKVTLPTHNGPNTVNLALHKVLYVSKLSKNLLSVPAMALTGAEVRFDKTKCVVIKDGKEFIIGHIVNDKLY